MFLSSAQQRKREEREQQALCHEKRISEVGDGGGIVVDLADVEAESAEDALVERKAAFIGVVPLVCCFFYRRGFGFGKRARGERARARRKRDECGEGKKMAEIRRKAFHLYFSRKMKRETTFIYYSGKSEKPSGNSSVLGERKTVSVGKPCRRLFDTQGSRSDATFRMSYFHEKGSIFHPMSVIFRSPVRSRVAGLYFFASSEYRRS